MPRGSLPITSTPTSPVPFLHSSEAEVLECYPRKIYGFIPYCRQVLEILKQYMWFLVKGFFIRTIRILKWREIIMKILKKLFYSLSSLLPSPPFVLFLTPHHAMVFPTLLLYPFLHTLKNTYDLQLSVLQWVFISDHHYVILECVWNAHRISRIPRQWSIHIDRSYFRKTI